MMKLGHAFGTPAAIPGSVTANFHETPSLGGIPGRDRPNFRAPGNGAEVLLVGADDQTRAILAELLRLRGFEVCELPPGRDTWLRHDASCFSAVLMDRTLLNEQGPGGAEPLIQGREVTRLILPGACGNPGSRKGGEEETILMGKPEVVDGLMAVLREFSSRQQPEPEAIPTSFPEFR